MAARANANSIRVPKNNISRWKARTTIPSSEIPISPRRDKLKEFCAFEPDQNLLKRTGKLALSESAETLPFDAALASPSGRSMSSSEFSIIHECQLIDLDLSGRAREPKNYRSPFLFSFPNYRRNCKSNAPVHLAAALELTENHFGSITEADVYCIW